MTLLIPDFQRASEALMASLASRQYDWHHWSIQELRLETWSINAKTSPSLLRQSKTTLLGVKKSELDNTSNWMRIASKSSPSLIVEKLLYSPIQKNSPWMNLWDSLHLKIAYFAKEQLLQEAANLMRHQKILKDCEARLIFLNNKCKNSSGGYSEAATCLKAKIYSNKDCLYSGHPSGLPEFFCL